IPVGSPGGSEITPDGTVLYVAQPFQNRIAVVSTVAGSVVGMVQLPDQLRSLLLAPDGSRLYLATAVVGPNRPPRGAVHVVATDSDAIVASIPVGLEPVAAALTPDGSLLYVANKDSGSISAISTETGAVVATIVGG
ncbi:MAG TPA: hypothetical protein VE173_12690, partial [Longimicrobiales bacterium]|nr:hypothetical protein [Longimicrobiales bacterium]